MKMVVPSLEYLESYAAALKTGWSPNNMRAEQAQEELAKIEADAPVFLASFDSTVVLGEPLLMPDGTKVPRLPGYRRWMWDGEFAGSINLRWQAGTGCCEVEQWDFAAAAGAFVCVCTTDIQPARDSHVDGI